MLLNQRTQSKGQKPSCLPKKISDYPVMTQVSASNRVGLQEYFGELPRNRPCATSEENNTVAVVLQPLHDARHGVHHHFGIVRTTRPASKHFRHVSSWSAILSGCSRELQCRHHCSHFDLVHREYWCPYDIVYTSVHCGGKKYPFLLAHTGFEWLERCSTPCCRPPSHSWRSTSSCQNVSPRLFQMCFAISKS